VHQASRFLRGGYHIVGLPQKLAFIVQPNRLQGLIWQALLRSQGISVILESAHSDLADCLTQISVAGLTLPNFIVLSTETPGLNPYEFCRWCQANFPAIQVFLTRVHDHPLSDTERRWAIKQGASAFFDGFSRETLMSNAVSSLNKILSVTDDSCLDERALLTVLLNVRRQLSSRTSATQSSPSVPQSNPSYQPPIAKASPQVSKSLPAASPAPLNDLDWVASGLRALNQSKLGTTPQEAEPLQKASTAGKHRNSSKVEQPPKVDEASVPVRRYRGVAY
jgi:hypothetical protein